MEPVIRNELIQLAESCKRIEQEARKKQEAKYLSTGGFSVREVILVANRETELSKSLEKSKRQNIRALASFF